MKKKLLLVSSMLIAGIAIMETFNNEAQAYGDGAPPQVSGAPSEGNCTKCHMGTATPQGGLITTDIPASGYNPGQTYTITAKVSGTGKSKFGFEVSPHAVSGKAGTLIVTNSGETKLVGSGKYITHVAGGTLGSGAKTWNFNWTAPEKGAGTVTFYGAFNIANNDGKGTGDQIITSTLAINEHLTGIEDNIMNVNNINLYPNPTADLITIQYALSQSEKIDINLVDIQGKVVKNLLSEVKTAGEYKSTYTVGNYPAGNYFIQIKTDKNTVLKKMVIQ